MWNRHESQTRRPYASRRRARSRGVAVTDAPSTRLNGAAPPRTDFLREAIDLLAKGREMVQRQRDLIAKLKSKDRSTLDAEQTLQTFLISLTLFERDAGELLRELSARSD